MAEEEGVGLGRGLGVGGGGWGGGDNGGAYLTYKCVTRKCYWNQQ